MTDSEYGDNDKFIDDFAAGRDGDGYGMLLDKGTQEQREMADEFNGVEVGDPIEDQGAEGVDLPPAADVPVAAPSEEGSADPIIAQAASADVAVGAPIATPEAVATPLPAASSAKKAASDMDGMNFGEVFKHFRGKGEKGFQWRGKTYTTALKNESQPAAATAAKTGKTLTPDQETAVQVFAAGPAQQAKASRSSASASKLLTHDGFPARQNPDGTHSTELTVTVTDPRLNGGKPTNIPSLWGGVELDEDAAVRKAIESRKTFQSYASISAAVEEAKAKSARGGANAPAADKVQQPRPPLKESTSGIGPKLNPAMQPKPGARGIYEGAGVTLADSDKRVNPLTVTGKDGQERNAQSMADLMASRKGAQGV